MWRRSAIASGAALVVCCGAASAGASKPAPCDPSHLRMVVGIGQVQEAAGSILLSITARSAAPCSLTGRPRATVRLSNGRVVGTALQSQPVPNASPGVFLVGDVTVSRTQPAYVLFSSGAGCRIADIGPPFYVEITIWLAGEQRRITTMPKSGHVGALRIPAQCPPLTETPYYQDNPAPR